MWKLFMKLLIVAVVPVAAAQSPAPGAKGPAKNGGYAQTYTICKDVQYLNPVSSWNTFSPVLDQLTQRWGKISGEVLSQEWKDEADLKVTQLASPKHGLVKTIDEAEYFYTFVPDKDYLGQDRVTYEIEAFGLRYHVVINFWIVPVIAEPAGENPYVPDCTFQDFGSLK